MTVQSYTFEIEDIPHHRALVKEHLIQLIDGIVSKEMVDKIPMPIKAILIQINHFGRDRGRHYAGILFISRFLSSALADPIRHRLVPGHCFLSHRVKRNFKILSSILRGILEPSSPEAELFGFSELLRDFRSKLETFMDGVVKSK